jgi:O-acetyl-ADP-ribose deacetylase (regulator of RNase III)
VAFPAVSTGAFRWPVDDAARIAVAAVRAAQSRVEEARFVLFSDEVLAAFRAALE